MHRHWFDIMVQFIPSIVCVFLLVQSAGVVPFMFPDFWKSWFLGILVFLRHLWRWCCGFGRHLFLSIIIECWIITDRRVVNVEQKGLFVRQVSELRYQKKSEHHDPRWKDFSRPFSIMERSSAGEKARFSFIMFQNRTR